MSSTVRLTEEGSEQQVAAGQTVTVAVSETPSTGYVWNLRGDPDDAVRITDRSYADTSDAPGASGTREWSVEVVRGPQIRLTATLSRPWEQGAAPHKTASAVLVVSG